jgi:acyl-CoA thioester hydrolase
VTFAHVIRERTSGRVIVEGSATLAATTLDGKVKRLPPAVSTVLHVAPKGIR